MISLRTTNSKFWTVSVAHLLTVGVYFSIALYFLTFVENPSIVIESRMDYQHAGVLTVVFTYMQNLIYFRYTKDLFSRVDTNSP